MNIYKAGKVLKESDIARINELYHKQKEKGLTEEEKEEQARLRQEYLAAVRKNMRSSLDRVSVVNPDGTVTNLSDVRKKKGRK